MITERDQKIIDHLKSNGPTDLPTLNDMFFPGMSKRWANKRLNDLADRGHIKKRKTVDDYYNVYYWEG